MQLGQRFQADFCRNGPGQWGLEGEWGSGSGWPEDNTEHPGEQMQHEQSLSFPQIGLLSTRNSFKQIQEGLISKMVYYLTNDDCLYKLVFL